ncbi:MAG: hypothetical protein HY736_10550 [Verrucomicrobia bacterium]|nr:hypothetical protein [Verrucomicrobiota bacterium]
MNVSCERRTALMLLRQVGRRPAPGAKTDQDVQVMAAKGRLFFINSHTTAACEALVLKPGAFWIRRALLERVLRSFDEKEIIILEADRNRMTIGRFSCSVRLWQAKPIPPEGVELIPGTLRLSGGGG